MVLVLCYNKSWGSIKKGQCRWSRIARVALVVAMRARVRDRGACGPLADRCAAAAARRELAGHLLVAAPVWRNVWMSSMITKLLLAGAEAWAS